MNAVEETTSTGIPIESSVELSCKLHVIHAPQSARPMTTAFTSDNILLLTSGYNQGADLTEIGATRLVTDFSQIFELVARIGF